MDSSHGRPAIDLNEQDPSTFCSRFLDHAQAFVKSYEDREIQLKGTCEELKGACEELKQKHQGELDLLERKCKSLREDVSSWKKKYDDMKSSKDKRILELEEYLENEGNKMREFASRKRSRTEDGGQQEQNQGAENRSSARERGKHRDRTPTTPVESDVGAVGDAENWKGRAGGGENEPEVTNWVLIFVQMVEERWEVSRESLATVQKSPEEFAKIWKLMWCKTHPDKSPHSPEVFKQYNNWKKNKVDGGNLDYSVLLSKALECVSGCQGRHVSGCIFAHCYQKVGHGCLPECRDENHVPGCNNTS